MSNQIEYKETGLPWCPEIPKDWEIEFTIIMEHQE